MATYDAPHERIAAQFQTAAGASGLAPCTGVCRSRGYRLIDRLAPLLSVSGKCTRQGDDQRNACRANGSVNHAVLLEFRLLNSAVVGQEVICARWTYTSDGWNCRVPRQKPTSPAHTSRMMSSASRQGGWNDRPHSTVKPNTCSEPERGGGCRRSRHWSPTSDTGRTIARTRTLLRSPRRRRHSLWCSVPPSLPGRCPG